MRWLRVSGLIACCWLIASVSHAQFRSGGLSAGDSAKVFEFLAKGRPYFLISETRSLRDPLMQYAKEKGIANEQITRDHFTTFMARMQNQGASAPADKFSQVADVEFKRRDRNGDGKLNPDEMNDSLRNHLATYDANRDGLIDFPEYSAHYFARMTQQGPYAPSAPQPQQPQQQRPDQSNKLPTIPVIVLIEDELESRPTVYRVGKMPKELPKWYFEIDADSDGQISLHEWIKGGKVLEEYKLWDRNDDGVMTPEEYLRHIALGGSPPSTAVSPMIGSGPMSERSGGGKGFFKKRS